MRGAAVLLQRGRRDTLPVGDGHGRAGVTHRGARARAFFVPGVPSACVPRVGPRKGEAAPPVRLDVLLPVGRHNGAREGPHEPGLAEPVEVAVVRGGEGVVDNEGPVPGEVDVGTEGGLAGCLGRCRRVDEYPDDRRYTFTASTLWSCGWWWRW